MISLIVTEIRERVGIRRGSVIGDFPLLYLAQTTLLIGKPGYINNLLKCRVILSNIRTSDAILLEGGTTRNAFNSRAFSSVVPRTWNILQYDLRNIQYSYCFNIKLKNHFNSI